jgi:uncharacterized repeat protein (TIGR03803 family)
MSRLNRYALALTLVLSLGTLGWGQRFKVLHKFHGGNGSGPGLLIRDATGNLYGLTGSGGAGSNCPYGCGTAFKLDRNGKQVWSHNFNGANGGAPYGGLLQDAGGDLFGTTFWGGAYCSLYKSDGCGTVFKLNSGGKKEVKLHNFSAGPDGGDPDHVVLVEDSTGNLYGTTSYGGAGCGVVFKMNQAGKETVMYTFTCSSDGAYPLSGVIRDNAGNLYGTTSIGGDFGWGAVYMIDSSGGETVLYSFTGGADGGIPIDSLIMDEAGDLYGVALQGGNRGCSTNATCGTVFELSPASGGGWIESTLYKFCSEKNCADGGAPSHLVRDPSGNLYGTALEGGRHPCFGVGCGVVFKLDGSGKETVLHSFSGPDGMSPYGIILGQPGHFYGATTQGGDSSCAPGGCGLVYSITF